MSGVHPGEPEFGPWTAVTPAELVERVLAVAGEPMSRVGVIAVDGRSGSGKTTVAGRLASVIDLSVVAHTDDIAWHHSFFDWTELMIDHVLAPARRGEAVDYRPEAWSSRGRDGAIEVPADTRWVIVEGVGAARRELVSLVDAVIWVQSDDAVARSRGIERDGGDQAAAAFWDEWMAAEEPFLEDQRPWERATVIVNGTPPGAPDPAMLLVSLGRQQPDPLLANLKQTIILVMSKVLSLSEVKAKLSEVVDEIDTTHERVTVTRNGRPVVVLMSADDLEAIEETVAILSDPAAVKQIEQGRAAIEQGDTASKAEIEALRDRLRSDTV